MFTAAGTDRVHPNQGGRPPDCGHSAERAAASVAVTWRATQTCGPHEHLCLRSKLRVLKCCGQDEVRCRESRAAGHLLLGTYCDSIFERRCSNNRSTRSRTLVVPWLWPLVLQLYSSRETYYVSRHCFSLISHYSCGHRSLGPYGIHLGVWQPHQGGLAQTPCNQSAATLHVHNVQPMYACKTASL